MSCSSLKDFLAFEWSDDNNNAQSVPGQRKEAIMIDMEPAQSKHKSSDDVDKPVPSKHFKFVSSDDIEEFAHIKAPKATVYSTSGLLRTSLTGPNNAPPTTPVLQFQQVSRRMVTLTSSTNGFPFMLSKQEIQKVNRIHPNTLATLCTWSTPSHALSESSNTRFFEQERSSNFSPPACYRQYPSISNQRVWGAIPSTQSFSPKKSRKPH